MGKLMMNQWILGYPIIRQTLISGEMKHLIKSNSLHLGNL